LLLRNTVVIVAAVAAYNDAVDVCRNGVITSWRGTPVNTAECPVSVFPLHKSGLQTLFSITGAFEQTLSCYRL